MAALLILLGVTSALISLSTGFQVVIVCAMDLFRGYIDEMEGYTVPAQQIGTLGSLGVSVLLPEEWHYASCCQRIQMTLFPTQLMSSLPQNVSSAEWTHCTSDVKHMTCVVQPQEAHSEESHDDDIESIMMALTLQQCQMPENNQVTYELFLYTNSSAVQTSPAPIQGTADVSIQSLQGDSGSYLASMGSWLPCVLSGGLDTAKHQFPLKLGQVTIRHPTSFSYLFTFILDNPSNDVIFEALFVSGNLPDKLCDGKPHISLFQLEAPRKISLSIGNAWSGCRVENVQGMPVYYCEGGRTFVKPGELDIYINVCKKYLRTFLNYTLEILESRKDCSLQSGFSVTSGNCKCPSVPLSIALIIFAMYSCDVLIVY